MRVGDSVGYIPRSSELGFGVNPGPGSQGGLAAIVRSMDFNNVATLFVMPPAGSGTGNPTGATYTVEGVSHTGTTPGGPGTYFTRA